MMIPFKGRHVPLRGGPPKNFHALRPSIEYTPFGNVLCFDEFGGRAFRCGTEHVEKSCQKIAEENKEDYRCYNDLYDKLGIIQSDFGYRYGWCPGEDEDYGQDIKFQFTMYGPGTDLYDRFGEQVFAFQPEWGSMPWDGYMEV